MHPILAAFLLAQATPAPIPDEFLEKLARDLTQMQTNATPACGPYPTIVQALADGYSEAPAGMGLQKSGALLQLFVSPGGSFSVVEIAASGKACVVAGGHGWETMKPTVGTPS